MTSEVTACRSCRAPIRFVRTTTGKLMPLDAEPNPDGNVELVGGRAVVHAQPPLTATELYMPHHATCPDADDWRKP